MLADLPDPCVVPILYLTSDRHLTSIETFLLKVSCLLTYWNACKVGHLRADRAAGLVDTRLLWNSFSTRICFIAVSLRDSEEALSDSTAMYRSPVFAIANWQQTIRR